MLRQAVKPMRIEEIKLEPTKELIQAMFERLRYDDGVGLAAPQVNVSKALVVIDIHPSKYHPGREQLQMVVINPKYEGTGKRVSMWEGCLSSGDGKSVLFGRALRYKKVLATYLDENGLLHEEELDGLLAHVFQHETDHLNGMLFVDRVKDTTSYMTGREYRKRILKKHMS